MMVSVKFKTLNKNGVLKQLGKFFQQNKSFYIEIDKDLSEPEKVITFIEEALHFLIRLYCVTNNLKPKVYKEHAVIKEILRLFEGLK